MGTCAVIAVQAVAVQAFAAHPLQTEDTGTQGTGYIEIENGFSRTHMPGSSTFSYQPQLSYGVSPTLDVIVQPSWLQTRTTDGTVVKGWGDTNADIKWRYYGHALWSLGVRAGMGLGTSEHGLGIKHGGVSSHVLMVATLDATPFTVHGNLGYTHNPADGDQKQNAKHASVAAMWSANERWGLTGEATADSSTAPGSASWLDTVLVGVIYRVEPQLDLDLGYQSAIHIAQPTRGWLFGITYRFAP